jgi:N-acetylmuramoyl-L-alanine amidase
MTRLTRLIPLFLCALCLAWASRAAAETQAYNATVDGVSRAPEVLLYYADQAPYVPLIELAQELGGSARIISPTEAEVTVNGVMATLSLNNVRYATGGQSHDLTKPFLTYEAEVLAPRDDVVAFFNTAFGVKLNSGDTPAPEPAVTDEETGLLEEVSLPPAEAAPAETVMTDEEAALLETDAIAPAAPAEEAPAPGAVKTIVIDAGHGGNDPGAQGASGVAEKDVALAVANKLAEQLKADARFTVVLTRTEDNALTAAERATIIKQHSGAFLLSLHAGASLSKTATGLEVFYPGAFSRSRVSDSRGRAAAEALAASLKSETGSAVRGVRRAPLALYELSESAGCLVELGCISNPADEQRLGSTDFQDKAARALALGLAKLAEEN